MRSQWPSAHRIQLQHYNMCSMAKCFIYSVYKANKHEKKKQVLLTKKYVLSTSIGCFHPLGLSSVHI